MCSLHFALHKMTAPLKLPVNDQDGIELEKIEDHVSDGMVLVVYSTSDQAKYYLDDVIVRHNWNRTSVIDRCGA